MRRLVGEESGVALGLAVVMVLLVGVMGAGLLTLIAANLEGVVEVNRGRQAFEMAEAGVEVAKARLAEDPSPGSVIVQDLDGDPTTEDSASVKTQRLAAPESSFRVISIGRYGSAKRVIEATFSTKSGVPKLLVWRECYSVTCGP